MNPVHVFIKIDEIQIIKVNTSVASHTVLAFVNFSSHFLISSGETLLFDKSMYPAKYSSHNLKFFSTLIVPGSSNIKLPKVAILTTSQILSQQFQVSNFGGACKQPTGLFPARWNS